MKHLCRSLVTLVSLLVIHTGCGDGQGKSFTQAQAVDATKVALLDFYVGMQLALFELEGESGDFDLPTDCTGAGTAQYTGTVTLSSDGVDISDISMDTRADGCSWSWSRVDATLDGMLHYEGTPASFAITGQRTFSGDTLSGDCSFDAMAMLSADGERFTVTGTACGRDVSGDYMVSELIESKGEFTLPHAVEVMHGLMGDFAIGILIAFFELGGESGDFDVTTECTGGGTTQYTGTVTVISDEEAELSMDARADGCRWLLSAGDGKLHFGRMDGTVHYEGTPESVVISGELTYSGTLSGECPLDVMVMSVADTEGAVVTGTVCGQDVSGEYELPVEELSGE